MTTYSIRLDDAQRALLAKGLAAKGWNPTHFIRQAALEKAAHIDNTSKLTSFDFDAMARRVAQQLCDVEVRFRSYNDPDSEPFSFDALKDGADLEQCYPTTYPLSLEAEEVQILRQAIKLGGLEFLRKVVEECDRIVRNENELPAPIDPAQFD